MPIPTIVLGTGPGFGLDGTTITGFVTAGQWAIISRYSNNLLANTGTPNGWAVSVVGGRVQVTPPPAQVVGGWYKVETRMGAGNAPLTTEFFLKTAAEVATGNAQIVKGVQTTIPTFASQSLGSNWQLYNGDGVFQAADYNPQGWGVTLVGSTQVRITPPASISTELNGWYLAGPGTRVFFDVLLSAPTVPPPPEQHGPDVEVRIYDKAGKRRRLPSFNFGGVDWTIEPSGGYSDFSLSIASQPTELTSIAAGDRIEIYKFASRQYRGYVTDITRSEDEPATLTLSGYGRILDLERMILSAVYQRAQPVDISELFAEIAADVQTRMPGIAIETQQIGVSISTLDCRNKTARQALSDLCSSAPSACHWGFDVDDQGRDRLYIRRIDLTTADTTIVIPSANVGQRSTVQSLSDVINALIVTGGTPAFPQLLPNGSFEVLAQFSDDTGGAGANLLLNPSFESGTSQNSTANWSFSGGASAKPNGGQEANAYQGNWAIELDQSSETVTQIVTAPITPIVSGRDYTFGIWSRAENNAVVTNPSTSPAATATVSWRDASGDFTTAGTFAVLADVSAWRQYERTFRAPAGATGFRVQYAHTSGSTGANKGLLLDSAYAFDNSSLIASGWGLRRSGTAAINAASWSARGAFDGRNCLYLSCISTDTDNNDVHVRLTPDYRITVVGGQRFRFQHRYRGVSATATVPKQQVQWQWYKSDGSKSGGLQRADLPAQVAATWTLSDIAITAPGDATQVEIWIAVRGSGEILLDALSFRDAGDATDSVGVYLPEGNFQARYLVSDLVTSAENADVNGSIAAYGLREAVVSVDGVDTFTDAKSVARGYFLANASGLPAPCLDLYDDRRPLWIGYRVRLSGASGAAYSTRILPVMRLNGSIDGNGLLTHNLELVKPILTDEELLARLMGQKARGASSAVAANSAASTSIPTGSSSGGTVSSGGSGAVASVNGAVGAVTVSGANGLSASTSGTAIKVDGSTLQSAAAQASSAAAAAQSTANTANTAASNAQTTANAAQTAASNAQNTANSRVPSVNGTSTAITIQGGTGISTTTVGGVITINATGGGGSTGVAGVSSVSGLSGDVILAAGNGLALAATGQTLTLTNTRATGTLTVRRNFGTGEVRSSTNDYILILTDPATTTHAIAWSGTDGGATDSQTIWNCKSSGNIVVTPGSGNTFVGVSGNSITLTPGQMVRCIAVQETGGTWTVYTKLS